MIYKINILWCVIVSPMYYCACKLVPFNAFMLENCFAWLCIAFEYLFSLNIVRLIVACVQISQKARKHIWLVDECCWVMMSDDDDNYTIPILYLYCTYTIPILCMQYICNIHAVCVRYIYICTILTTTTTTEFYGNNMNRKQKRWNPSLFRVLCRQGVIY